MTQTPRSQETRSATQPAGQVDSPWAAQILDARRRAGLTQEQLAEQAGVGVGTVKNIEAGKVKPQRAKLDAIKGVLGLNRVREQSWTDEEWQIAEVVVALYSRLPESQRAEAAGKVTALFAEMLTGTALDASGAPQVETHAGTTGNVVEYSRKPHAPSQVRARGARGTKGSSKA